MRLYKRWTQRRRRKWLPLPWQLDYCDALFTCGVAMPTECVRVCRIEEEEEVEREVNHHLHYSSSGVSVGGAAGQGQHGEEKCSIQ